MQFCIITVRFLFQQPEMGVAGGWCKGGAEAPFHHIWHNVHVYWKGKIEIWTLRDAEIPLRTSLIDSPVWCSVENKPKISLHPIGSLPL